MQWTVSDRPSKAGRNAHESGNLCWLDGCTHLASAHELVKPGCSGFLEGHMPFHGER